MLKFICYITGVLIISLSNDVSHQFHSGIAQWLSNCGLTMIGCLFLIVWLNIEKKQAVQATYAYNVAFASEILLGIAKGDLSPEYKSTDDEPVSRVVAARALKNLGFKYKVTVH